MLSTGPQVATVPCRTVLACRGAHLEVQGIEHLRLHGQDLLARVRLVRDVHEVPHFRRVDLLVLGRQQHRRDAHQLQLLPHHHLALQEAVDLRWVRVGAMAGSEVRNGDG